MVFRPTVFKERLYLEGHFLVNRRGHLYSSVVCRHPKMKCLIVSTIFYRAILEQYHFLTSFSGENRSIAGSFREAIWPLLVVGQCFGVMPVIGVSGDISEHQFKWKSFRTLFSLLGAVFLIGYTLFLVWVALQDFHAEIESSKIGL